MDLSEKASTKPCMRRFLSHCSGELLVLVVEVAMQAT